MWIYMWIYIFMLFLYIFINNMFYENFQNKIERMDRTKCGKLCTRAEGCKAFSFDSDRNICWISKDPIYNKPYNDIFANDYNRQFIKCNKLNLVQDPVIATNYEMKQNASFKCYFDDSDNNIFYNYIDKEIQMNDVKELDDIVYDTHNNKYNIYELEYPQSFLIKNLDYDDVRKIIN